MVGESFDRLCGSPRAVAAGEASGHFITRKDSANVSSPARGPEEARDPAGDMASRSLPACLRRLMSELQRKLMIRLRTSNIRHAAVAAAITLIFAAADRPAVAQTAERPNILFFFADDWGRIAGCYGDGRPSISDVAITPNIDAMAARGVVFENAFVNAPSCTPCRSSLLSGRYFWQTGRGAILRGAVWDESIPSWPLMLKNGGYAIGKSYKVWSPGTPADAPFGRQQYAFEGAGREFNQFSQKATAMVAAGKSVQEAKAALLAQARENFARFLDSQPEDQPFCYWFGPTNTHRRWTQGSGKALWGIDPDSLRGKLPAFMPDVPQVREDMADYLGEIAALDAALAQLRAELQERGELENTLIVVSGDHGPPGFLRGKCNLYDFGTAVPLIASGPGVAQGVRIETPVSLLDIAPTLLEIAGVEPERAMVGISLLPALRGEEPETLRERGAVFAGRERHVDSAREGFLPYPQRSIRTDQYLLIRNFEPDRYPLGAPYQLDEDPQVQAPVELPPLTEQNLTEVTFVTLHDEDASPTKEYVVRHRNDPQVRPLYELAYGKRPAVELYDVVADPDQMNNLAASPEHGEVRERLLTRLNEKLIESGDPRMIDGGRYFETPPLGGVQAKR